VVVGLGGCAEYQRHADGVQRQLCAEFDVRHGERDMAVICKSGVTFRGFPPAMVHMLTVLRLASETYPEVPDQTLVITSANDGTHAQGSRHYMNEALDVRSKSFRAVGDKQAFASRLQQALGEQFTVLLEDVGGTNEHFHCQVRKGHVFVQSGSDGA
jgi:hypothetical protein